MSVTPIKPRPRSSGVPATHRHTSQTSPSAAVIVAATGSNPVGITPDVVGGVVATVVEVDVVDVLAIVVSVVLGAAGTSVEAVSSDAHPPARTSVATSHARVIADTQLAGSCG
jgi:hypothetical protein